jgi:hypothetical protein
MHCNECQAALSEYLRLPAKLTIAKMIPAAFLDRHENTSRIFTPHVPRFARQ